MGPIFGHQNSVLVQKSPQTSRMFIEYCDVGLWLMPRLIAAYVGHTRSIWGAHSIWGTQGMYGAQKTIVMWLTPLLTAVYMGHTHSISGSDGIWGTQGMCGV